MDDIKSVLGNNIRALRKQAGWTQERLAEKASISVPFMTQIELARKSASLEVVESIARALGISYDRLFTTTPQEESDFGYKLHLLEKDIAQSVIDKIHERFEQSRFI